MPQAESDLGRVSRFEIEALPHLKLIHRSALRIAGNKTGADDLTQEVYLQAWRSFDRFTAGTNCRAWLYQILFHTVSHYRRKESRYFTLLPELENLFPVLPPALRPTPRFSSDEWSRYIQQLPPRFRRVLILVDVEEYSYNEAANHLKIPIGTVMSRLCRARRQLKKMIEAPAVSPSDSPKVAQ